MQRGMAALPERRAGWGPPTAAMAPRSSADRERRQALIVRLQIFAAAVLPVLLLGLWLQSRGFFTAP